MSKLYDQCSIDLYWRLVLVRCQPGRWDQSFSCVIGVRESPLPEDLLIDLPSRNFQLPYSMNLPSEDCHSIWPCYLSHTRNFQDLIKSHGRSTCVHKEPGTPKLCVRFLDTRHRKGVTDCPNFPPPFWNISRMDSFHNGKKSRFCMMGDTTLDSLNLQPPQTATVLWKRS